MKQPRDYTAFQFPATDIDTAYTVAVRGNNETDFQTILQSTYVSLGRPFILNGLPALLNAYTRRGGVYTVRIKAGAATVNESTLLATRIPLAAAADFYAEAFHPLLVTAKDEVNLPVRYGVPFRFSFIKGEGLTAPDPDTTTYDLAVSNPDAGGYSTKVGIPVDGYDPETGFIHITPRLEDTTVAYMKSKSDFFGHITVKDGARTLATYRFHAAPTPPPARTFCYKDTFGLPAYFAFQTAKESVKPQYTAAIIDGRNVNLDADDGLAIELTTFPLSEQEAADFRDFITSPAVIDPLTGMQYIVSDAKLEDTTDPGALVRGSVTLKPADLLYPVGTTDPHGLFNRPFDITFD